MKLGDPFGRVARRDRDRYAALRERLQQAEVRDAAGVRAFARNITITLARLVAVIVAVALGAMLLFPSTMNATILLSALVLLWLAVGYVQTRLYLERYRREECADDN